MPWIVKDAETAEATLDCTLIRALVEGVRDIPIAHAYVLVPSLLGMLAAIGLIVSYVLPLAA
jgi:hypothetical protein